MGYPTFCPIADFANSPSVLRLRYPTRFIGISQKVHFPGKSTALYLFSSHFARAAIPQLGKVAGSSKKYTTTKYNPQSIWSILNKLSPIPNNIRSLTKLTNYARYKFDESTRKSYYSGDRGIRATRHRQIAHTIRYIIWRCRYGIFKGGGVGVGGPIGGFGNIRKPTYITSKPTNAHREGPLMPSARPILNNISQ